MREIEFRTWDKKYYMLEYDVSPDLLIGMDGKVYQKEERNYAGTSFIEYEVASHYEVMQYTGLKDKNEIPIYEGDIVSTDLSRPFLIVEFRNGAFMYQCHDNGQDYYDHMEPAFSEVVGLTKYHEVIGNIYENPELLETK